MMTADVQIVHFQVPTLDAIPENLALDGDTATVGGFRDGTIHRRKDGRWEKLGKWTQRRALEVLYRCNVVIHAPPLLPFGRKVLEARAAMNTPSTGTSEGT